MTVTTGQWVLVAWVAWTVVLGVAVKRRWVDWWQDMGASLHD